MTFASFGGKIKVFDYSDDKIEEKASHNDNYSCCGASKYRRVSWAGDGNWLTGPPNEAGFLPIMKYEKQSKLTVMRQIPDANCGVFLNYTNRNVVIGSKSGAVKLWDIKKKAVHQSLCEKGSDPIKFLDVSCDDNFVAATGQYSPNPTVKLYGITTSRLMHTLPLDDPSEFSDLKFSTMKKNLLACSTVEGRITVWDLYKPSKPLLDRKDAHIASCTGIAPSPVNYNVIVSISLGGGLLLHDIKMKETVFQIDTQQRLTCVDFDSNRVIVGTSDGHILFYDLRNCEKTVEELVHDYPVESIRVLVNRQTKTKPMEELGINTPEEVVPEKAPLEMSVADVFTPPSTVSVAPVSRSLPGRFLSSIGLGIDNISPIVPGTSVKTSFAATESTPNQQQPDSPSFLAANDSFFKLLASPAVPSPTSLPPTSSPLLPPSSLNLNSRRQAVTLQGIQEEIETSSEKSGLVNGSKRSSVDESNQLLREMLEKMTEIQRQVSESNAKITEFQREVTETRTAVEECRREVRDLRSDMERSNSELAGNVEREIARCRDWIVYLYQFQEEIVRSFAWENYVMPTFDYSPNFFREN